MPNTEANLLIVTTLVSLVGFVLTAAFSPKTMFHTRKLDIGSQIAKIYLIFITSISIIVLGIYCVLMFLQCFCIACLISLVCGTQSGNVAFLQAWAFGVLCLFIVASHCIGLFKLLSAYAYPTHAATDLDVGLYWLFRFSSFSVFCINAALLYLSLQPPDTPVITTQHQHRIESSVVSDKPSII